MKVIIRKNDWLPGMAHGWGNGYVIIPKGHPLHGKDYDDIDVEVHGGLTFSEAESDIEWLNESKDKTGWVVGFDTAHYNDNQSNWTKEKVQQEADRLAEQLQNVTA